MRGNQEQADGPISAIGPYNGQIQGRSQPDDRYKARRNGGSLRDEDGSGAMADKNIGPTRAFSLGQASSKAEASQAAIFRSISDQMSEIQKTDILRATCTDPSSQDSSKYTTQQLGRGLDFLQCARRDSSATKDDPSNGLPRFVGAGRIYRSVCQRRIRLLCAV